MKNVALSVAKGLYNGEETLTALACSASVGRDEHAPSHRPDALRESDINWICYSHGESNKRSILILDNGLK